MRRRAAGFFVGDEDLATTLLDPPIGGLPPSGPGVQLLLPKPAFAAAPPPCPLIIKVGRGLENTVSTKVIYGRPGCR